jgi:uncharacterized protein (DUF58 family)
MADGPAPAFPGWTPSFQAALERLAIAVRRPARSQHAGAVRSRIRGRALEFADYRAYTPGDDPKLVDWRAYARLDRLYLKRYEEERARTLTLLIDASASMDWGEGEEHKGLYARRLAAALAWIALGRLEPVRVYLLRDGSAVPLQPVLARPALAPLLARLGAAQESGRADLAAAVRTALASRAPGPAILLTDLLDSRWADALDALAAMDEGTVLQVLAPDEWEPSLGEEMELQDAETGELRPTRLGPGELAAYRGRLQAFLTDVRDRSQRCGLLHVALNTATPLQETTLRRLPAAGILR